MIDKYSFCVGCPFERRMGVRGRGKLDSEGHARIVFVGENPGNQEIVQGKVFIGPSGKLLADLVDFESLPSYWITNVCLCYGPDANEKTRAAPFCHNRLIQEIADKQPALVVPLGNIPTIAILGKGPGITHRRGTVTKTMVGGYETTVIPTVHPAATLRNGSLLPFLEADLKYAANFISEDVNGLSARPLNPEQIPYTVTEDFYMVLGKAQKSQFCVLDIETNSLDPITGKIILLVFAPSDEDMIYLVPGHAVASSAEFRRALVAASKTARWSGHNSVFDRNFIEFQLGVRVDFTYDTLLAHYLLDERKGTHGAKEICSSMFHAPAWERPLDEFFAGKKTRDYSTLPPKMLYTYAANDGYWQKVMTRELHRMLKPEEKLVWIYKNLLIPGTRVLSNAEISGVLMDRYGLGLLVPKYETRTQNIYDTMERIVGRAFNPRSTPQVARILFDELHLPEINKRSTGAKDVLAMLEGQHAFVPALLDYREAYTLYSRYVKGLDASIRADGRVHTSYNLAGTVTGRLSSADPNLQNQPSRQPEGKKDIRDLFLPDPGCVWIEGDYSQIEYRMIALLSQDPYLIQCYQEGRDLHGETALDGWGPNFTKANRSSAKTFNFALLYGASESRLQRDGTHGVPSDIVHRIVEAFFSKMSKVVDYNEGIKAFVLEHGYIESPLGRKRRFSELPYIQGDSYKLAEVLREAINMPSQSAASDVTLSAMIALDKIGLSPRLTVHDSITICAAKADALDAAKEMQRCMEQAAADLYGDQIPYPVELEWGERWGSMKAMKEETAK